MAELIKTAKGISFGRGVKADYTVGNGQMIYFATDEQKIYMNGVAYDAKTSEQIQTVLAGLIGGGAGKFISAISKDTNGNLTATYSDFGRYKYTVVDSYPEGTTVSEQTSLPEATASAPDYVRVTTGEGESEVKTLYKKEVIDIITALNDLAAEDESLQSQIDERTVKSVSATDKVLSQDANGVISSDLNLTYDSGNKKLKLWGKSQTEAIAEVDATAFLKDGMLDTAAIVDVTAKTVADGEGTKTIYVFGDNDTEAVGVTAEGKYIRLVFNTDSYNDANHDGVDNDGAEGASTKKEDIFLAVNDILSAYKEGKDIAIKADNTINVSLDEDITLLGTTWGAYKSGDKIAKGTSLSEILKGILIKVVDVAANKPTVSISASNSVNGDYEIGTEVAITLSKTYTDGYFSGSTTDGYISGTGNGSSYTKQPAGCTEGATVYKKDGVSMTQVVDEAEVARNTDTINITATEVKYTAETAYGANTNIPFKNDGTKSGETIAASTAVSSAVSYKGYYKYYLGHKSLNDWSTWTGEGAIDSDDIKTLTEATGFIKTNTETVVNATAKNTGAGSLNNGKCIVVAYPSTYSLKTCESSLGASIKDSFETHTVSYTNGNSTVDYTVAILPNLSADGIAYKNLTIGK